MRMTKLVLICALFALVSCKDKDKGQESTTKKEERKAAEPSPQEKKAAQDEAIKAAEAPALAAFEKHKEAFLVCDRMRLEGIATMKAAAEAGKSSPLGTSIVGKSRECLVKWWATIDGELKEKKIPKDVWITHQEKWAEGARKFVIPAAKPLEGGKAYTMKGTNKGVKVTLSVPKAWKAVVDKKNGRIDFTAEGVHLYLIVDYEKKVKSVADVLGSERTKSGHIHSQEHKVADVPGALVASKDNVRCMLDWVGAIDVHPKYQFGDQVTVSVVFQEVQKHTEAQIQQFMDILGTMKFVVPPRKVK